MMLMTKFGKFKLRLIATINLSVLLSIFNIASTTSNYWVKYKVKETGFHHFAGLWRSCSAQGECQWQSGIVDHMQSIWSIFVRVFVAFGTITNLLVIVFLLMAFFYKINKKSKCAIQLMEWVNCMLIGSFIIILIGFCVFVSSTCNFSMWLHVFAMILMICTSNMVTRTFATLYFKNTRAMLNMKSVETAVSHSKLPYEPEEKIALNQMCSENVVESNGATTIEMNKISENSGSKEALIPTAAVVVDAPAVANNQENLA